MSKEAKKDKSAAEKISKLSASEASPEPQVKSDWAPEALSKPPTQAATGPGAGNSPIPTSPRPGGELARTPAKPQAAAADPCEGVHPWITWISPLSPHAIQGTGGLGKRVKKKAAMAS
jgi:hypothetical protein